MSSGDELRRATVFLERLLEDPQLRADFRRRPAKTCRAFELDGLADELDSGERGTATLELRESRSGLAGVMIGAAAEGLGLAELLARHASDLGNASASDLIARLGGGPDDARAAAAPPAASAPAQAAPAAVDAPLAADPDAVAAVATGAPPAGLPAAAAPAGADAAAGLPAAYPPATAQAAAATQPPVAAPPAGLPAARPAAAPPAVGAPAGAQSAAPATGEPPATQSAAAPPDAASGLPATAQPATADHSAAPPPASAQPAAPPAANAQPVTAAALAADARAIDPTAVVESSGQRAVELARQHLGEAYVWGGASPQTGFDCSGLVQYVYSQVGVHVPRVTQDQINVGQPIELRDLRTGDMVFFRDASGDVHHVGLYLDHGRFLHAPHTGDVIKISSLDEPYYAGQFTGGRRVSEVAAAAVHDIDVIRRSAGELAARANDARVMPVLDPSAPRPGR
jgi:cell wall-associated NlpC family hydrolase